MVIEGHVRRGSVTRVEFDDIRFGIDLEDEIFALRWLERRWLGEQTHDSVAGSVRLLHVARHTGKQRAVPDACDHDGIWAQARELRCGSRKTRTSRWLSQIESRLSRSALYRAARSTVPSPSRRG